MIYDFHFLKLKGTQTFVTADRSEKLEEFKKSS
jgi:hypothetical protein